MDIFDMYKGAEELGLDEGQGSGGAVDAVADVVRAEVAEIAVQLEEQSQQIEELTDAVAEMDENVEELAENVEGMEHLLASGNFNATSFALLYSKSLKLANKLGADIGSGERMGAESFSDAATAQMMARSGMEGFMDTVKEYGRKAIEFIKHIFNTVINFFVSLFNQADALKRRVEQLKKRIDGGAAVKEKVKLGGWNIFFDYEKNGLGESKKKSGWSETEVALGALTALGKNVSGITIGEFNSAYSALISAIKSNAKSATKASEKKQGTTDVIIGIENGIRVRASYSDTTPKDLTEAAAAARSIKIQFAKDPEAKKLVSGEAKAKLKKPELLSVLASVNTATGAVRQAEISKKFSAAERDRVVGSLNAIKADDGDKTTEINKQISVVRAVYSVSANLAQAISKHHIAELRATLDGVAAHIGF